jgi:endonuclease I
MKPKIATLTLALLLLAIPLRAQVDSVLWNFSAGTLAPATDILSANFGCTNISSNASPAIATTSASSGTWASGGNNLGFRCAAGSMDTATSSYLEWALTYKRGASLVLQSISFGVRSTSTGAQSWCLRSSSDRYSTNIATAAIAPNSTWALQNLELGIAIGAGQAVTFRLYFSNGTSSTSVNTRVDDLKLSLISGAKLTVSPAALQFSTQRGKPASKAFAVNGIMLEQDIHLVSTDAKFAVSRTTISVAQANSSPQTVTVTFSGSESSSAKIVLTTVAAGKTISDTVHVYGSVYTVGSRPELLPPPAYYHAARNKAAADLKTALYNVIKDHRQNTYDAAWIAFLTLDVRPECASSSITAEFPVWDIYTDRPGCVAENTACNPGHFNEANSPCAGFKALRMGLDQTGTGGSNLEGVTYEREHTFPKGWWHAPKNNSGQYRTSQLMYTDLFHIFPCDHHVNNVRNDLPYGMVDSTVTEVFTNGSKVGYTRSAGAYRGRVYEPIDEYKGDVARNYFYMVTRYENTVQHWSKNITWGGTSYMEVTDIQPGLHSNASPMLDTNRYPVFAPWAIHMLLEWHRLDPVSEKERVRNYLIDSIFQKNRNPYVDHPELVEFVWGDSVGMPWRPLSYDDSSAVESPVDTLPGDTTIVPPGDTALLWAPAAGTSLEFALYPNPAHSLISFKIPSCSSFFFVEILNATGQRKASVHLPCTSPRMELALDKGMYFVRVTAGKKIGIRKLVIE